MKFRILTIIINYKTPDLVINAVESIIKQTDHTRDRIVIVDNFSNDGSVKAIQQAISNRSWSSVVKLLPSPINGGFSAGNNLGIQSAEADYYLLLNSDALLRDGAIESLLKAFTSSSRIGIVGPRLEWEDGNAQASCFNNLTPPREFKRAAETHFIIKQLSALGVKSITIPSVDTPLTPEWISFACVMIRSEVITDVGLMDEGFFMYREDNDYCRRVRKKNWGILFWPDARVIHLNKGASNSERKRLPYYFYKSRSYYYKKYYGILGLLLANTLWEFSRVIMLLRSLLGQRKSGLHPSTWRDIWIGFIKSKS